jgi:ribosome-associated protein
MSAAGRQERRTVEIREASIRLGQLLKLADLVDTGADAKLLLSDGDVQVNGEVETRRGRRLLRGDVVTVDLPTGPESVVVAQLPDSQGMQEN